VPTDPYLNDPDRWGVSMAQHAELMLPCLDAAGVRSIVEVGAFAGDLTRVLVEWAQGAGARVAAVDPSPQPGLVALAEEHPELDLIRETSLAALPALPELPDAVVIDGDHNYFTVFEELRLIGERAPGAELPLLLFHDVAWPHGRRDDYFDAEQIPEEFRLPQAGNRGGLVPGEPGIVPGGLPYPRSAEREGFVASREGARLVVVPVFFGFGVVWHQDAPYAAELARILDPFDRNPILERLEANRVHQLARVHQTFNELWAERERRAEQESVLRRMLESSAFAVAERLSLLRMRAGVATDQSVISREEVKRVLDDGARG
jgi:hypothetical protein